MVWDYYDFMLRRGGARATGGIGGIYIRAVTRTGFFVATNIKIRQGVEYKSYTENDVRKGVLDGYLGIKRMEPNI